MTQVLVLNSGSSSVKYQLVDAESADVLANGLIERIGEPGGLPNHKAALAQVLNELDLSGVAAVGHRVVHGGEVFYQPTLIDDAVETAIEELSSLAPLHNPPNLTGIRAAMEELPNVPHVAVFDTAFFHGIPKAASTYAIDRDIAAKYGIRKFGFHGTSHEYVSSEVAKFLDRDPTRLNQIVLHLGNGASASAVRAGKACDTTMGLTPLEGLVMGTRSGDIDPGALLHLQRNGVDVDQLLNRQSGLKGLCGDNDFRQVVERIDAGDQDAKLAYDVYIHRLRRYIGAYLVDLGRVDAITFTAGVGENSSPVRTDALKGLEGFGIVVDPTRNAVRSREPRYISPDGAQVAVLVVPTNEELAIARKALKAIGV
ncbi:MAG: acetate kinase [Nocardiaceae bacterium]|nr:acetate kinase [Nocardiaceae bacterium]